MALDAYKVKGAREYCGKFRWRGEENRVNWIGIRVYIRKTVEFRISSDLNLGFVSKDLCDLGQITFPIGLPFLIC